MQAIRIPQCPERFHALAARHEFEMELTLWARDVQRALRCCQGGGPLLRGQLAARHDPVDERMQPARQGAGVDAERRVQRLQALSAVGLESGADDAQHGLHHRAAEVVGRRRTGSGWRSCELPEVLQLCPHRRSKHRRLPALQAQLQPVQLVDQPVHHRAGGRMGREEPLREFDGLQQDAVRVVRIDPGGGHAQVVVGVHGVQAGWQGVGQLHSERGAFDRLFRPSEQGGQVRGM